MIDYIEFRGCMWPQIKKKLFYWGKKGKNLDAILESTMPGSEHLMSDLWYIIFVAKFVIYTKFHLKNHSFRKQFPKKGVIYPTLVI